MKPAKAVLLLMFAVLLSATSASTPATATPATAAPATGPQQLVVKVRSGQAATIAKGTGAKLVMQVSGDTAVLSVSPGATAGLLTQFRHRPDVLWAERNVQYRATSATAPNDPCFVATCHGGFSQTNLTQVHMAVAWAVTTGNPSMKVAVLDSGVDVTHPDLTGRITAGPNFSSDTDLVDDYGHGTFVAGVIGAAADNGVGMAGVDPTAQMVAVKVLDSTGSGYASQVAMGLRWAADNGERIANLSLAGPPSQVLADAVSYAQAHGVLVVAAAGNDTTNLQYPAAYPDVLSVGASDATGNVWARSNAGSWISIVAPGVRVVSTWPVALSLPGDPYQVDSGTSMSTPEVTGVAALLWSARPGLSADGVRERLMATATPVAGITVAGITGGSSQVASGQLNAGAALSNLPVGYRLTASDGGVFAFGDQPFSGSTGGQSTPTPTVAGVSNGTATGYWEVNANGDVHAFGSAVDAGSLVGHKLNRPIVGAAATASGNGYWLVASDGGVFSFGDAQFYGSMGGHPLNQPIVAMIATVTGNGYWLIASDGGVFAFGDAQFFGSTGGIRLNRPVVGGGKIASGNGYWLVASDGGVFSFGDAQFDGSMGGHPLNKPVVAMATSPAGNGYWLVASDGGVFTFGDATFRGSMGAKPLNAPVVAAQ